VEEQSIEEQELKETIKFPMHSSSSLLLASLT
jgi:hypothetical protein